MATFFRISRAASLVSHNRRALDPASHRPAASPFRRWLSDSDGDLSSGVDPPDVATTASRTHAGTVKYYNRQKAYGFVIADDSSVGDVFVHGLSIDSSSRQENEKPNPYFPFLKRGERVSFDLDEAEGGSKVRACRVRFENGSEVPYSRKSSRINEAIHNAKGVIGGAIFQMMETDGENNAEHVGRRAVELYEREMKKIRLVEEKQVGASRAGENEE